MRKIIIAPKKERDDAVIREVRKLLTRERKLRTQRVKIEDRLRKLAGLIHLLQERCPHRRKKWWYGDIAEGWNCRDCGVEG